MSGASDAGDRDPRPTIPDAGLAARLAWLSRAMGALLIVAAMPKLLDPEAFALAIFRYQMVPGDLINAAAVLLPWVELCTGAALVLAPRLRRGALGLAALLFAVFAVAVTINLVRGVVMACGCFSVDPDAPPAGPGHIAVNAALAAACVWLFRRRRP